ncbi:sensor histidine kinase [Massilia cavernae]|nr:sensor histidine kinase [Massilia cavernae]
MQNQMIDADLPSDGLGRDGARALRLIERIESRYGLAPSRCCGAAHSVVASNDSLAAGHSPPKVEVLVNDALLAKIFQCERAEEDLRNSKKKLHDLLAHHRLIKEEERKRISREIHDTLGQNLLALRLDISTLHVRSSSRHPRLHKWVGSALDNLDGTIKSVRALIADLRPFQLDLGLEAAVEWELIKFTRTSGIACNLAKEGKMEADTMTDEQTLTLYRTLQECLSNVSRHSQATKVDVVIGMAPGEFWMSVSDNGIGFDPGAPRKAGSFGMLGIGERVSALDGEVSVSSAHSQGTTVTISVPIASR